jgi:hypothetical protein
MSEPTTCGLSISELIAEHGLECGNCGKWRIISAEGDVEDCPCGDEGWNLYDKADVIVP